MGEGDRRSRNIDDIMSGFEDGMAEVNQHAEPVELGDQSSAEFGQPVVGRFVRCAVDPPKLPL